MSTNVDNGRARLMPRTRVQMPLPELVERLEQLNARVPEGEVTFYHMEGSELTIAGTQPGGTVVGRLWWGVGGCVSTMLQNRDLIPEALQEKMARDSAALASESQPG